MLLDLLRRGKISASEVPGLYYAHGKRARKVSFAHCRKAVKLGGDDLIQCNRKAIVNRGGYGYCRQHDPERTSKW